MQDSGPTLVQVLVADSTLEPVARVNLYYKGIVWYNGGISHDIPWGEYFMGLPF